MKPRNINVRVLLVALVPALSIALLLGLYFGQQRFTEIERSLAERGLAVARQLAPAAEYGVFSGNREILGRLVNAVSHELDVSAVTIRDVSGSVLATAGAGEIPMIHDAAARALMQGDYEQGLMLISSAPIFQTQLELEEFFYSSLPAEGRIAKPPNVLGRVFVAMSRASLAAQREWLVLETLAITLGILAANIIIAILMSRNIARPLTRLTSAVRKLADGDLDTRVTPDSDGIVRALEHGVNTMAAALKSAHADLERRVADATAQLGQKKEEAERANRAKSRFLAAASHDLRQPLHALGLFVATLRGKPMSEEAARVTGQIERSVSALQDLLDALLNISRLDAGVITPQLDAVPVNRLLSTLAANFAPAAEAKGLALRVVPSSLCVHSDAALLERILLNLVSNAVRYTAGGRILLGCRRRGGQLRIEVWDTGIGIPADQQCVIFEEFYQVPGGESGEERGIGLGLAIVDRLARLLGHAVEVRSRAGGSMFAISVPIACSSRSEQQDSVAASRIEGPCLAGLAVMVVDDDIAALSATCSLLEGWGCTVLAAESGAQAEWLLRERARMPDLVICDYRLSRDETGLQVLERLRQRVAAELRAIVISADTSSEVAEATAACGCPLLYKPLRPAHLHTSILQLLDSAEPSGAG